MLERAEFQAFARKLGINNDTKLVIYDHQYDATRVWWGFMLYGKTARVLDGGFQAWKTAGYDTDTFAPSDPAPGTFTATEAKAGMTALMADVARAEKDTNIQLWDNRETVGMERRGPEEGRIPQGTASPGRSSSTGRS